MSPAAFETFRHRSGFANREAERALADRYTGEFCAFGPIQPEPYDPDFFAWAATLAPRGPRTTTDLAGGAGWTDDAARAACLGEAIERFAAYPSADDMVLEDSYENWSFGERVIDPRRWVLFHDDQYAKDGFPFERLCCQTRCHWTCFRDVEEGGAWWVPEDFAYLHPRRRAQHRFAPSVSTGLSCARSGAVALLRGAQECIERDALVGAWWGRYALERLEGSSVWEALGPLAARVRRRNLEADFFRIHSPFSEHVVMATLAGEDKCGWLFSTGSACRETLVDALGKALLEAIQGRLFVRHLLSTNTAREVDIPQDFRDHATWYSRRPEDLGRTVLARVTGATPVRRSAGDSRETLAHLCGKLGNSRPVLFRNVTPPVVARRLADWLVLKVIVPGLQPLHASDSMPMLGGPLWAPRAVSAFDALPPHPFA